MAKFRVTGPDGHTYNVTAPDGASEQDVLAHVQAQVGAAAAPQRDNDTVDEVLGFASGANDAMLGLPRALAAGARSIAHGFTNPADEYRQLRAEQEAAKARAPGAALAGDVAGSVATAAVPIGKVAQAGKLALKAGEPIRNLLRLAGVGAIGGAEYGAARGAADELQAGGDDVAGAALGGAAAGAIGGAVVGPVGAGIAKGATAIYQKLAPSNKRAIDLLAKRIDMAPPKLAHLMSDWRSTTGQSPSLAAVLKARQLANVEDLAGRSQGAAAIANEAADAARAALPENLAQGVELLGPTDRVANLRVAQSKSMDKLMGAADDPGALRRQQVLLTPGNESFFADPTLRSAIAGDKVLQRKISRAQDELSGGDVHADMTVDDFERLRQALRGRQSALLAGGKPTVARDVGQLANEAAKFVAQQHPSYGQALEHYAAQERFIQGFQHGHAGKSGLDVANMGDIRTLDTPEGAAGLEAGAFSRMVAQARSSESKALSLAKDLAQNSSPASRESLSPADQASLRRLGAAHAQEQINLNRLAAPLRSKPAEEAENLKNVGELAVAGLGHATTGFAAHAVARFIRKYAVSAETAEEAVRILTDPARAAQLPDALRKAGLSLRNQRIVLSRIAQATGRLAGAGGASLVRE